MTNIIETNQFKTISNSARSLRVGVLVAALLIPASLLAGPITVNWDDLPNGAYNPTPGGYGGLNWYFGDSSFGSAGSGDFNGQLQYSTTPGITLLSSPNAAYNAWGCTPMRIESQNTSVGDEFTFSGYFSGQGYSGFNSGAYQIEVQGFTGGSSTADFTQYLTLSATGWTELNLTTAVNKLLLTPLDSSGGTIPQDYGSPGYFWMDDVTIGTVPDTGGWLVTLTAGGTIFGMMRFRRSAV